MTDLVFFALLLRDGPVLEQQLQQPRGRLHELGPGLPDERVALAVRHHDAAEEEEVVLVAVAVVGLGHEGVQLCDQLKLQLLKVGLDHAGVAPGVVMFASR